MADFSNAQQENKHRSVEELKEQTPGIWVCRHPQWIEESRCATWSGCDTGTPMPPDVMWTVLEYCPICGETRQRPVQMNDNLSGGEAVHSDDLSGEPMIHYAHQQDPKGVRFRQYAKDPVPAWAVDVQPCTPNK